MKYQTRTTVEGAKPGTFDLVHLEHEDLRALADYLGLNDLRLSRNPNARMPLAWAGDETGLDISDSDLEEVLRFAPRATERRSR